jgi:hypothetical protein
MLVAIFICGSYPYHRREGWKMKKSLLVRLAILILTISTLSACSWSIGGDKKGAPGEPGAPGATGATGATGAPAPAPDKY